MITAIGWFLKSKGIPESCKIEIKKLHNYWRQTHASNTWIYSVHENTPAEITCNGKMQNIIIENSGLLKMQPECHFEAEDIQLWAYDAYSSDVNYVFPIVNISKYIPSLKHLELKSEMEMFKIPYIPSSTKILGFPTQIDMHHLTHYGMSFTTFVVIIGIIIALYWVIRKTCQMPATYLPAAVALPRLI